ncbi:MAG TPA: 3-hydroxyacyl-CoA dehydrogenase family protein, partial [Ferruginibacter sp.]|nr:3-hydroxyacyl-CoA dehydrogenase family protein [Ferruginibacter sp.]
MKIVVVATDEQWAALGNGASKTAWHRVKDCKEFKQHNDARAFFSLTGNILLPEATSLAKPIFINSVTQTLKELDAPINVLRINAWPGFLQRPAWEVAGSVDTHITSIFERMNKKIIPVPDEPGLIAARIIAMIINEAYFATGDEVSSKKEIDTAMKLGTNYPYGPFEWAALIGPKNVLALLEKLST